MLLQNKRCQQHLRADNAAPHMSTVPQVLLPCCLAPPVETFHPPEWLLERRVSAWIYNLMGSLNLKSCCKYYLLSLHSHLYGGNKGWQESLGSELIFIPTIAVHTNQHPLPDIYCFAHLGSKEEQALWELKGCLFPLEPLYLCPLPESYSTLQLLTASAPQWIATNIPVLLTVKVHTKGAISFRQLYNVSVMELC